MRKLSVPALNMLETLRTERCDILTTCWGKTAIDLVVDTSRAPYKSIIVSVSSVLAMDYEALNFFLALFRPASAIVLGASSRYWFCKQDLKYNFNFFFNFRLNILTISSSSGILDRKSNNSLFGIVFGLNILRVNFVMPQNNNKNLMGIKCNTTIAPTSKTTASHVNSGTEKLNVLKQ